ncbi:hypothetical protein DFAR_1670001 [Desulfarculales bacterium]
MRALWLLMLILGWLLHLCGRVPPVGH